MVESQKSFESSALEPQNHLGEEREAGTYIVSLPGLTGFSGRGTGDGLPVWPVPLLSGALHCGPETLDFSFFFFFSNPIPLWKNANTLFRALLTSPSVYCQHAFLYLFTGQQQLPLNFQ